MFTFPLIMLCQKIYLVVYTKWTLICHLVCEPTIPPQFYYLNHIKYVAQLLICDPSIKFYQILRSKEHVVQVHLGTTVSNPPLCSTGGLHPHPPPLPTTAQIQQFGLHHIPRPFPKMSPKSIQVPGQQPPLCMEAGCLTVEGYCRPTCRQ